MKVSSNSSKKEIQNSVLSSDTTKPEIKRKVSISGIFLSIGSGLSIPLQNFSSNSNPTFGIMGRIEYGSTSIFPIVFGGEVSYFSYNGSDEFKTMNLLNNFKSKILGAGLALDYSLAGILKSSFTNLFLTADVKTNFISREYDGSIILTDYPVKNSRISVGAGIGFTLYVFDLYLKYNYMKDFTNFGVYTKIKFPVIRF